MSSGGGVYVLGGTVSLTNATVTGNGSSNAIGGGLVNQAGNLALQNVTLQDNFRGSVETGQGATTSARNTIFGKGYAVGSDGSCSHAGRDTGAGYVTGPPITSDLGHNLDEDGTCALSGPADVSDFARRWPPRPTTAVPTPTVALLDGSPAIDGGNGCAATDQRGVTRPDGSACDIGALEARRFGDPGRRPRRAATDDLSRSRRRCRSTSTSRARRARSSSPTATSPHGPRADARRSARA